MERTINLSDELLSEVEGVALSQGRTVDQFVEDALRAQMEDRKWQDLLAYGRQKGMESGYTSADVPRLVKEWREEQRGR